MKTIQIGQLKAYFSDIIRQVRDGEEIIISYGRKKEKVAVIIPYDKYNKRKKVKLGLLEGKAKIKIKDDFEITEDDFLNL